MADALQPTTPSGGKAMAARYQEDTEPYDAAAELDDEDEGGGYRYPLLVDLALIAAGAVFGGLGALIRGAARLAARRLMREGGWLPQLIRWEPPSVAEQHHWAKSKGWLPDDCDPGGPTDLAGTVFYATIGTHGYAFFLACAGACLRPRRFIPVFAVTVTVLALVAAIGFVLIFVVF